MDYSLPGSSDHGDAPGKNTRVGCYALLQGIFPTQGLNLGLPHCSRILYHLSHKGSPAIHIYSCSYLQVNSNKSISPEASAKAEWTESLGAPLVFWWTSIREIFSRELWSGRWDEAQAFTVPCLDVTSHQHCFKLPAFGRAHLAGQAPGLIWDLIWTLGMWSLCFLGIHLCFWSQKIKDHVWPLSESPVWF